MSKRPGAHARVWRVDRVNPAIDTGDLEVLRDRHLAHYAALAQRAGPLLEVGGIVAWLERLDADRDNLRAAMGWAAMEGSAAAGLRLAAGCTIYWEARAHFAEARARMTELLERLRRGARRPPADGPRWL